MQYTLNNRLPHSRINSTPYEKYTGKRPSAKHLHIFGCPIIVRNLGRRPHKLDLHTSTGTFIGYTATDKNVHYIDNTTHRIKTATHCTFDEASMTIPPALQSPAAKALQNLGYSNKTSNGQTIAQHEQEPIDHDPGLHQLKIKLLPSHATMPERATTDAAGYDVFSAAHILIPPQTRSLVPLDIQIKPPPGTYIKILSRSSHATKNWIDVKAGVIDPD